MSCVTGLTKLNTFTSDLYCCSGLSYLSDTGCFEAELTERKREVECDWKKCVCGLSDQLRARRPVANTARLTLHTAVCLVPVIRTIIHFIGVACFTVLKDPSSLTIKRMKTSAYNGILQHGEKHTVPSVSIWTAICFSLFWLNSAWLYFKLNNDCEVKMLTFNFKVHIHTG